MSIRTEEYSFNNKIIYKHYCTTMNDLYNIPEIQITLGSIAYINNEKTFIANSNHTWNIIDETSAKTINDDSIYICEEGEYDNNFIPTIGDPSTEIIYLVPTNNEANHQYNEYKWVDDNWVLIGIRTINTTVNISIPIGGTAGQKLTKIDNENYNMEWANESDPTISNWAKAETKPSYTATEVGALPNSTFIPTKTSDLTNDSNFVTNSQLPSMDDYYNKTEVDNIIQNIEDNIDNMGIDNIIEILSGGTTGQVLKKKSATNYDTEWANESGGGGGGGTWGSITGTLSNQTDLYNALGNKANSADVYTKTQVDTALAAKLNTSDLLNSVYPVGSIYMSISSANPGTLFGGTWVSFGEGRVLVGVDVNDTDFNAAQKTGGEKTHTLTENELPNITGDIQTMTTMTTFRGGIIYDATGAFSPHADPQITYSGRPTDSTPDTAYHTVDFDIGGDQPHNNMPPYITCYMWRRTA